MNIIDYHKPLSEQYHSIDFKNFASGDTYVLSYRDRYLTATIGHFRHGVAIARTDECDYLINTKCEVLYCKEQVIYRISGEHIQRSLKGFKIMYEEDVSAPGKDSDNWQKREYYMSEDSLTSKYKIEPSLIENDLPYERGKIIQFGNSFYDFETYDYLFSIPPTSVISTVNYEGFIDSYDGDGRVYDSDTCFNIQDSQYYKDILVKVNEHKIEAYYPFNVIDDSRINSLFHNNSVDECRIDVFDAFEANKYVKRLFQDDYSLNPDIEKPYNLFNEFPELKRAFEVGFKIHKELLDRFGIDCIAEINGKANYGNRIAIRFVSTGIQYFILRTYIPNSNSLRKSKKYVFHSNGDLLSTSGYDKLAVTQLNMQSIMIFERDQEKGIAKVVRSNSQNYTFELQEKVLIDLNEKNENENDHSWHVIALTSSNLYQDYEEEYVHSYDSSGVRRNMECEDVAAIGIIRMGWENHRMNYDLSKSVFYADLNSILEIENYNGLIRLEPIIDGYLYQLPDNHIVNRQSTISNIIFREFQYKTYDGVRRRCSDPIIKIATPETIRLTQFHLQIRFKGGNPYVTHIEKLEKLSNNTTQYYLFEYRPFGKMDSKGNISYEYGDPEKVLL